MKKLIITLFLLSYISTIFAVTGYKDLKFGMSREDVLKSGICNFDENIKEANEPWMEQLRCRDLKVGDKKKIAAAIFIQGKLVRFTIFIELSELYEVVKNANEIYGPTSSELGYLGLINIPGNDVWAGFDNDTVMIRVYTTQDLVVMPYLFYQVHNYDYLLSKYRNYSKMEI